MKKISIEIIEFVIGSLLLLFLFMFLVAGNEKVLVNKYKVSSPIETETFNISSRLMNQSITFADETGSNVVLEKVLYDGNSDAKEIFVYRIGKWKWMEQNNVFFFRGYHYYVTDEPIEEK